LYRLQLVLAPEIHFDVMFGFLAWIPF